MKRPTIKDVAALAGVSAATVSRTLAGEPSVDLKIAQRVRAAATDLKYRPSIMARGLISSRTDLVALVVGGLRNPFDARVVEALSERIAKSGRRLLILPADYAENDPATMVALDYQVDGIIVAAGHLSEEAAERFAQLGVPVILYGRVIEAPGVDCIVAENFSASRVIGALFRSAGVRRATFVRHARKTYSESERERGFREGLGPDILLDVQICTMPAVRDFALGLLSVEALPQAVFCANDMLAFGVMEAAIQLGLHIPKDLMVAGFDDVEMASSPFFDLTTVHHSPTQIAEWVVSRVDQRLKCSDIKATVMRVPAQLKLRGSTQLINNTGGMAVHGNQGDRS